MPRMENARSHNTIREHIEVGCSLRDTLAQFVQEWPEQSGTIECPPGLHFRRDQLMQAAHGWFFLADTHFRRHFTYEDTHRLLTLYFNRLRENLARSGFRESHHNTVLESFNNAMELLEKEPLGEPIATPAFLPSVFEPNTAFILMWMDKTRPELEDVSETFKEVCKSFDIIAVRADDIEQSDKITDLILERIQSAEFLIADLTGERPNVYYEVGFAHAVGKRPILYRKHGTPLHFDLSVHNVPEYQNIKELRAMLRRRLEAMTGKIVP